MGNRPQPTYVEDDTADSGTRLGVTGLVLHASLSLKSGISDTVVIVEATEGHLIEIVKLHHYFFLLNLIMISL